MRDAEAAAGENDPPDEGETFYTEAMAILSKAGVDFMVGGAYALRAYTGIERDTKDFDVFMRQEDLERALEAFGHAGFRTDFPYRHWLAKAYRGEWFVDLIFRAGNGLCDVDALWFERAERAEMMGRSILLCPAEEILRMKCFIMERERYDGADIAHLLLHRGEKLDWRHMLERMGPDWRVLLSHLVLFGYIYPTRRGVIPEWVMAELLERVRRESGSEVPGEMVCNGTLISRAQYLPDIEKWGYRDSRLEGRNAMSVADIQSWTAAIDPKDKAERKRN